MIRVSYLAVGSKGMNPEAAVVKLIINPDKKQFPLVEGKAETIASVFKCIAQLPPDPLIHVTVGYFVEVAAQDHRIRTFLNKFFYEFNLPGQVTKPFLSFQKVFLESSLIASRSFFYTQLFGLQAHRVKVDIDDPDGIESDQHICINALIKRIPVENKVSGAN